jgi:hypothetical protein
VKPQGDERLPLQFGLDFPNGHGSRL